MTDLRGFIRAAAIGLSFAFLIPACEAPPTVPSKVAAAKDFAGTWQGTLPGGRRGRVFKIEKNAAGEWSAAMYFTMEVAKPGDDRGARIPVQAIAVQGQEISFRVNGFRAKFDGQLSEDGNAIKGTWSQGEPSPLNLARATAKTEWKDPSPHKVKFVEVEKGVSVEVLDWGGSGRPLILIPGLGMTAHGFDEFALELTPHNHVYGITRRGLGNSSAPDPGYVVTWKEDGDYDLFLPEDAGPDPYDADRMGDDVLAVMDKLGIYRPILAGHSIGGSELSSIGSRYAGKVAGLIYLDAVNAYSYDDDSAIYANSHTHTMAAGEISSWNYMKGNTSTVVKAMGSYPTPPGIGEALILGEHRFSHLPVPILLLVASPHRMDPSVASDPEELKWWKKHEEETWPAMAAAFLKGVPTARLVKFPNADHLLWATNQADVVREMNAFISGLPN